MELGLRRWKRRRRTPHDGCTWLVLASLGDRRCAGTRNRPTGLSAGEDWSLERVCSRARRAPETETRHCPETGRHRCRSRSAALWSRRSDRDHHSQELVPRRERGPSPRGKSSVATRSQRPRGERPFPRVTTLAREKEPSGSGRAKRRRSSVGPRRQSRGIDQGPGGPSRLGNEARRGRRWVAERWKAPRVVKVVGVSRAGGGSGLGNLRRVVKKACKRYDSNRGK